MGTNGFWLHAFLKIFSFIEIFCILNSKTLWCQINKKHLHVCMFRSAFVCTKCFLLIFCLHSYLLPLYCHLTCNSTLRHIPIIFTWISHQNKPNSSVWSTDFFFTYLLNKYICVIIFFNWKTWYLYSHNNNDRLNKSSLWKITGLKCLCAAVLLWINLINFTPTFNCGELIRRGNWWHKAKFN